MNTIGMFHSNPSNSFWGDAITRKMKDGRRRPCLSTDREFILVLAQLGTEWNILTKFKKNPTSGLGGDAITRNVYRRTVGRPDGRRRVPRT